MVYVCSVTDLQENVLLNLSFVCPGTLFILLCGWMNNIYNSASGRKMSWACFELSTWSTWGDVLYCLLIIRVFWRRSSSIKLTKKAALYTYTVYCIKEQHDWKFERIGKQIIFTSCFLLGFVLIALHSLIVVMYMCICRKEILSCFVLGSTWF